MIGRIAFWLLLPGLIATVVEFGILLSRTGRTPFYDNFFDEIVVWAATPVLIVLFISMSLQALLLVRRPQILTDRRLPVRIAILQFVLYGAVALWIALLVQVPAGALSVLFVIVISGISIALLVCILLWPRAPSVRLTEVELPLAARFALWGYFLIAIVGLMYAVASTVTPALDPGANQAFVVLFFLGLPLSPLVFLALLVGAFAGFTVAYVPVTALAVVANIAAVLLVLLPASRVPLTNWFFRLGRA